MNTCAFCDGACHQANLEPLLDPRLRWLWAQLARAADRRGDATLVEGTIVVRAPENAEERSIAVGLVGGRGLRASQSCRVNLGELTLKLRVRGALLTPGAVSAHALGRRVAVRAADSERRRTREGQLREVLVTASRASVHDATRDTERAWNALKRGGLVARLLGSTDPERLIRSAVSIIDLLPTASRTDRRHLATEATGNPHALDHGSILSALVLGTLAADGRIDWRHRPRHAWASVGVDYDDVVGGLISVGVLPQGWCVPTGDVVTIPPRVLSTCRWPAPIASDSWVFVTENPSVIAAASELATGDPVRLLCTNGTPSATEIDAIAGLAAAGWRIAVRADFDAAGLRHVSAILDAIPMATPWRMNLAHYRESLRAMHEEQIALDPLPETLWDMNLLAMMLQEGVAAYEEALLPALLKDLSSGYPPVALTV
jgi:uncharacterized protein (TIGR02679 family)